MLYNIGKKQEINPLESVTYLCIAQDSVDLNVFTSWLHKQEEFKPVVRRVTPRWVMMWSTEVLNFTTKIKWYSDKRGVFIFENKEIHFHIVGDIMTCW